MYEFKNMIIRIISMIMINVRTIIELWPTKSNGQWPTKPKTIYLLENGMIQGMILQEKSGPQLIGLKSTRLKT